MSNVLIDAKVRGNRPVDCLTATLHHLVLETPKPKVSADFYARALGCRVERINGLLTAQAPDRRLAFIEGAPKKLDRAGFALPDAEELGRLRARISRAGWASEDGSTSFFYDAVTVRDPDGTRLSFGLQAEEEDVEAVMSVPQARLQHVVMASREPERVVTFFTDVLGFTVSDTVLDEERRLRTSFLRCSAEHHSFAVFKAPRDWFDHHCYEATDWDAIRDWSDHFSAEFIRLQWGPGRHGPGNNLFVFIHDLDGNWVEISAELEIVDHSRPPGEWPHEERTLNYWGQGLLRS